MANKYRISVKFIFEGTVDVFADTAEQAKHFATMGQGICMQGGEVQSNSEAIDDWTISMKSNRKFGQPKTIQKGIEL